MAARNPWKRLYANVNLVANRHNGYGLPFTGDAAVLNARPVTITWEDLRDQFYKQQGKCYWFGIDLVPDEIFMRGFPLSMSVDRLDNARGYEKDNIVITTRLANLGRGKCSVETFSEVMIRLLNTNINEQDN